MSSTKCQLSRTSSCIPRCLRLSGYSSGCTAYGVGAWEFAVPTGACKKQGCPMEYVWITRRGWGPYIGITWGRFLKYQHSVRLGLRLRVAKYGPLHCVGRGVDLENEPKTAHQPLTSKTNHNTWRPAFVNCNNCQCKAKMPEAQSSYSTI